MREIKCQNDHCEYLRNSLELPIKGRSFMTLISSSKKISNFSTKKMTIRDIESITDLAYVRNHMFVKSNA